MNTADYLEVTVRIEPFSMENAEIVEAMAADLPYDSFVIGDNVVKCYIQKELYDRRALRLVLSELPFATTIMAVPVPFSNWNAEWESGFRVFALLIVFNVSLTTFIALSFVALVFFNLLCMT